MTESVARPRIKSLQRGFVGAALGLGRYSQLGGLFGQAFGQRGEALVAAAHHSVQAGALGRTPQHRRAAVLIIT